MVKTGCILAHFNDITLKLAQSATSICTMLDKENNLTSRKMTMRYINTPSASVRKDTKM